MEESQAVPGDFFFFLLKASPNLPQEICQICRCSHVVPGFIIPPANFISNISCLRKSGLMLHRKGRTTTFLVNKFETLPGPYKQLTAKQASSSAELSQLEISLFCQIPTAPEKAPDSEHHCGFRSNCSRTQAVRQVHICKLG